ncbi:PAS domain-containing sensor histidine kinase [Pseudoxanthomonas sp.]|uniref:PAS domain-containing sensor histidine kinase n=1 Tax=Pseudoxanthomonas sp. TaxID=1871049 RepID=UPI002612F231|nr:PAS domain-containing sensor histidine kinase [Pseudoxanthomonas sp.]WDS37735.1 MAG: ATP-binding protein [Pseudoxanthomonas sp.]
MPPGDRYRQIVELSEDCILELDADGRIASINRHGLEMLHASGRDDVVHRAWQDFWPAKMHTVVGEAVRRGLDGQQSEYTGTLTTLGGIERQWSVSMGPLSDAAGQVESLVVVGRDITEIHRVEQALRTLNASLSSQLQGAESRAIATSEYNEYLEATLTRTQAISERLRHHELQALEQRDIAEAARAMAEHTAMQAQKGEAIGQLVAGIAHDFNNMLQTAVAAISVVTDDPEALTPLQRKLLGRGSDALAHATTVAKRLLGFARQHPVRAEPMDVQDVAIEMAELMQQSLPPDVQLLVEQRAQAFPVVADRHSLGQAVMNLCINARDACDGAGQITLRCDEGNVGEAWATHARAAGDYVTLSVSDTGSGLSQEAMSRLFEPYFTTKPEGRGTGLGLAQVYALMRQAGGFIDVDSAVGVGTVMTLWFPRAHAGLGQGASSLSEVEPVDDLQA